MQNAIAQWIRRGEGLVSAKCGRPIGWGKLGAHTGLLLGLVTQDPDITMTELRDALLEAEVVQVHYTSVSRALRWLVYRYKRIRRSRANADAPMSPVPAATGQGGDSLACVTSRNGWVSSMKPP
jgi:transposase